MFNRSDFFFFFFSIHFVEEKTFNIRLEMCVQMSTQMSQNAPKVLLGGVGMPPDPLSICLQRSLTRSRNSYPSLFSHLLFSSLNVLICAK